MQCSWFNTEYSIHREQPTEYSIHWVQHTPSKAYTEYSLHRVQHIPSIASSHDRLSPAPTQSLISRLTVFYSTLYIPTITSEPLNGVTAAVAHPSQSTTSRSTTSKYSSNLDWSWPPRASLNSLNHCLQVHIRAERSRSPSASLSYSISPSKCISKPAWSRPLSAFLTHFTSDSKCISKFAGWWPPCASLSHSISASKFISKSARSQPPSPSLSSNQSRAPSASPNSLHRGLQVHLPVYTITAYKFIYKFSQSASPGAPANTLQYRLPPDWPYVYI